jgi:hypothetical protein
MLLLFFVFVVSVSATDVDQSIHGGNTSLYHVYVVNLAHRGDRLAHIKKELPVKWMEHSSFTTHWEGPRDGRNMSLDTLEEAGVAMYAGWELR